MAQNFLSQIYANHGIRIDDALQDGTGLPGTAGQILSSNATGVSWIDPSALPAGAAETVEIQVKNTSGGILTKGTPVYIKPSTSAIDRVEVAAADAGDSTKMPAVGLLAQDLNNQATGVAITGGMLTNFTTDPIDGSTPTSNDTVYVKVGGGLTLTKPTGATGLIQNIAKVGKVSGGNSGSLVVSSILRTNDVPNLPTGRIWVGDGNTIASTVVFIDETNGFFGINNATPTAQLDVTGKVNFEDLKLDGELLDQFNSPGANGMILQSLKLGPTNPQGINWVSAGQIVVTGIQENNNTAFIDLTAAGLGAGYVTGPVTISAELSASGTPTSANFLRGDNTWATAVTGLTVGNSNFIDLSNVGTATVPDITATLSASGTPLATNFLSGDNTWKQIEIASGNTNTLTVAFTNKNVLTVQTPGVGAATLGLATGKQIHDYIAGLTVDDLSPPTADFDVNNNKILNLTTPTLADDAANKAYVDNVLAGSGALIYQGGYNASTNTPDLTSSPNSIIQGWTYAVTVAGDASGFWSPSLNIGDLVIANVDNPTSISEWTEVQANIDVATAGTSVTSVKGIAGFNEDDFTAVNGFVSVKDDTYVPYTGATTDVDLGANNLIVDTNTLYVDSANNRVGIGTASPASILDLGSDSNTSQEIKISGGRATYGYDAAKGASGAVVIQGNANKEIHFETTADSADMIIDSSGRVGIGTASIRSGYKLDIYEAIDNGLNIQAGNGGSDVSLSVGSAGTPDKFVIQAGGNVGIGTDIPVQKMQIDGGSSNAYLHFSNTDTGSTVNDGSDIGINEAEDLIIWNREATNLRFATSSTERMRIDSIGKVGINESNPTAALHVVNSAAIGESIAIFEGLASKNGYVYINADDNRRKLLVFQSGGVNKFSMGVGDSDELPTNTFFIGAGVGGGNNADFVINSSGNVGIGTTSPSTELHVKGSAEIFRIDDSSSTGSPFMTFSQNGTRRSLIQYLDSGDLLSLVSEYGGIRFMTGTGGTEVERMRITSAGGVSFGTSGTNYGTTGQILTSNGNASPTWGGVTYAGLGPEFTDTDAGTTSLTLNFSTDQIFTRTVGGTYTVSGAQPGMVKQLITTGGSTFSITNGKLIAGSYDGTVTNFIQIAVQTSTSFWFSISQ